MKAVFPCKGVVVVTKQNVDTINNFYQNNLINSKLFSAYSQSNLNIQVGPFNYLPQNESIILKEGTQLLTIQELNSVLKKAVKEESKEVEETSNEYDVPIEDSTIMDHPFFKTLKPLN